MPERANQAVATERRRSESNMLSAYNSTVAMYLLWVILFPTLLIYGVSWVVARVSRHAFMLQAVFGVVGVPIHELSHALACLVFRMPITKVCLYWPNPDTGRLGYVSFVYNPKSLFHAVGLVVQGIAPLLMAGLLFHVVLPVGVDLGVVPAGGDGFAGLVLAGIGDGLALTLGNLVSGWEGFCWGILALLIGAHAIPSWADVRLALRGTLALVIMVIAICALLAAGIDLAPQSVKPTATSAVEFAAEGLLTGLEFGVYSVALVACVGLLGFLAIQLVPIGFYVCWIRAWQWIKSQRTTSGVSPNEKPAP